MLGALLALSGLGMTVSGGINALATGIAFPTYLYGVMGCVCGLKLFDSCLLGCMAEAEESTN